MRCLLGLSRLPRAAFGPALERAARDLEASGLFSEVRALPQAGAAEEGLPAGMARELRAADPAGPLVVLFDRGLFCTRESVEGLAARFRESGRLTLGLAEPQEHPCRFVQPQRVLHAGLLESGGEGLLLARDCAGEELFRVERGPGGTWTLDWRASGVPEQARLYLSRFGGEQGETVLGPLAAGRTQAVPLEELGRGRDLFFSVVRRVRRGPCDTWQPFLPECRNWDLHFPSRRLLNLDSGELIHGRQAYPRVFELRPEILAGAARDLLRAEVLAEAGQACGVPVEFRPTPAERCALLLHGAECAGDGAESGPEPRPACGQGQAGALHDLAAGLRPADHFVFQGFRGLLHLKAAQGASLAGLAAEHGEPAFRLRREIALEGLEDLRSVELLGENRLAVSDGRGLPFVDGPAGRLQVDCPDWTTSVFACGPELLLCNGPAQKIRRVLPHGAVDTVLDLAALPAPWNACAPQSASAVGEDVFLMLKDKQTLWQALVRFGRSDPAGTFRQASTPGMLQPLAAAGLGRELLLFDGEPFGVWRLEGGTPQRLWARFLDDLLVGLVQVGDRSGGRAVAVFRKHLLLLGPGGRVLGVLPAARLTGRAATVLRCAGTRAVDGRFPALDMNTNTLLEIEVPA